MPKLDALKNDFDKTVDIMRQRGLVASLTKYSLYAGGSAAFMVSNYAAPELIDAISHVIEQDMSLLSGPARSLYAGSMDHAMSTMSADVMGAVDWVCAPILANIEHFKNGTLIEYHREWLSKAEVFEVPLGQSIVEAWDWALTPGADANTATGRWGKPVIGVAAGVVMTYLGGKAAMSLGGKALNSAAEGFQHANEIVAGSRQLAKNLFNVLRKGVEKGMNAALGRCMPVALQNPFDVTPGTSNTAEVSEALSTRLLAAGVQGDLAQSMAAEIAGQLQGKDRQIEDLNTRAERLEGQMGKVQEVIFALNAKIETMVHPEEVDRLVRRSIADVSESPRLDVEDTPTLH